MDTSKFEVIARTVIHKIELSIPDRPRLRAFGYGDEYELSHMTVEYVGDLPPYVRLSGRHVLRRGNLSAKGVPIPTYYLDQDAQNSFKKLADDLDPR
jgi:hypothetical protein